MDRFPVSRRRASWWMTESSGAWVDDENSDRDRRDWYTPPRPRAGEQIVTFVRDVLVARDAMWYGRSSERRARTLYRAAYDLGMGWKVFRRGFRGPIQKKTARLNDSGRANVSESEDWAFADSRQGAVNRVFKEGGMKENGGKDSSTRRVWPLKGGAGEMDLGFARVMEEELGKLQEVDPKSFQALRAVIEGRGEEVGVRERQTLIEWGLLTDDGTPLPNAVAIMKAGLRETPDGPAIVDPIELKTAEDVAAMTRAEREREKARRRGTNRLRRFLFNDGEPGDRSP